ncbi:Leucine-rich repeat neuronal protein 1, partial [Frankliniella fusca]
MARPPRLLLPLLVVVLAGWGSTTTVAPSLASLPAFAAPSTFLTPTPNSTPATTDPPAASTLPSSPWGHACPEACLCGQEPLPLSAPVAEAADLADVSGPRPFMACYGVPSGLADDDPNVEVLRVSNWTVRRLDLWPLRRLPGLRVLDLQGNGVAEISGSGKANPELRVVDLSANSLHILGAFAFRDLSSLRVLNLSLNGLHSIAPQALALPRLRVLDLRRNRLAVLKPHFFSDAPALRELYLADNALSRVPPLVLAPLDVLDLSGNHIIRVEEAAFDAVNVSRVLDLSRNALRRVPNAALRRLGAVRDLVLSDNPLGEALAAGAVAGLAVRTLHLQRLRALATVHRGALRGLPELRELRLSANPDLAYVHPQGLGDVPRLHTLDLSDTPLLALERELLDAAPALRTLRLDNGTLHCHCSLGWLRNLTGGPVSCRGPPAAAHPPCAPYIIPLFPETFSETLGNNASFHCRALFGEGEAAAAGSVTWRTQAGVELSEGQCADGAGRVCVRDHVLTVLYLHAEDAGTYTCEARGAGRDARAVRLHVRDVHVRLLPLTVTSTFVTLAWNMSSAVTNSYTLRVQEVDAAAANASDASRSVTFTVGLKMHSYTVHGLKPRSRYAFTLAIQREAYSLVIGSTEVTTREGAFLVSLGIERNYLSIIVVSVVGGASAAACLGVCGLRCWRQRLRLREAAHLAALRKSDSAFSGREMLSQPGSPSADSPPLQTLFRGITYISLSDERSAPSECGRSIEQDLISFTNKFCSAIERGPSASELAGTTTMSTMST